MYYTLDIPPGVVRTGTEYKAKGRFYSTALMRWYSGWFGPIGGWSAHSTSAVTGYGRAIIAWRDDAKSPHAAIGTEQKLYVMSRSGALTDITPVGFTTGRANAETGAGYGSGVYGAGVYGASSGSSYSVLPASVWSLDTYGQYLVGVMAEDGIIYEWQLDTGTPAAAITGAPTANALVVTAEHSIMALGAADNPRLVMNSDVNDETDWTETVTNYARRQELQTSGSLICGLRINGGTLLFTDVDVWLASFIGQPFVYGYEKRGSDCGVVSIRGAVAAQSSVFWMGQNGFWAYDGYARPLPCDVQNYVFGDFNKIQASKVQAFHNSSFGEVWWFYCSAQSNEINRYIIYNYLENHWAIGTSLKRLSAVDRGVFLYPMMVAQNGIVYDQERDFTHSSFTPTAETGPIEIGDGDNLIMVRRVVPDESVLGNVSATFYTRLYPMSAETVLGPYSLSEDTPVRMVARQVSVKFTGVNGSDFKIGTVRLEGVATGATR
ncbi:MAG: hypothetical protein NVV72_15765 [Asticcacaulis sp.]|nr:hypothetical protein [Asticcacaulis sp.]